MKNRTKTPVFKLTILALLALQGCSSQPVTLEQKLTQHAEERAEINQQIADNIPSWFVSPPKSDGIYIYATGQGVSNELSMAEDKASMLIHSAIAEQLEAKTDSTKTMVTSEQSNVMNQHTANSSSRSVRRTTVFNQQTNYELVKKEVVFEDGRFIVYQLAKFNNYKYQQNKAEEKRQQQIQQSEKNGLNHYQQGVKELESLKEKSQSKQLNNEAHNTVLPTQLVKDSASTTGTTN